MSGIEIAGLLLGAFPLIISAMEHYQVVKKPTTIWWRIRKSYSKDYNRVKECEILFRDQLNLLLYPLLDDRVLDAPHFEELLANPGGDGWKECRVEDALMERLQHRYIPYTNVLEELKEAMEKLCKAARVDDPHFQGLLSNSQGKPPLNATGLHARTFWMTKANISFQRKRLTYSLTSLGRGELLEEVENCIRRLEALLKASTEVSSLTRSHKRAPKRPVSKSLLGFWKHAGRMYKLLQAAWTCNCRGNAHLWLQNQPSSVDTMSIELQLCHGKQPMHIKIRPPALQLRSRPHGTIGATHNTTSTPLKRHAKSSTSTPASLPTPTSSSTSQRVHCSSLVGARLQTVHGAVAPMPLLSDKKVQPSTSTTSISTADSICKLFGAPRAASDYVCLLREGDSEYGVHSADEDVHMNSTISISDALASKDLTRVQRCQIASTLASSHLQLHSSPWLHHRWDSTSVRLPITSSDPDPRAISATPYVLTDLDKAAASWPRKDSSFTSLGIVLLELCFDKRFTDHTLWCNYPGKQQDPLIRLAIAQEWAEKVAGEAGDDYASAVRWALKEAPAEVDSDSWRIDFAENVVQPLQRCCEYLKPRW